LVPEPTSRTVSPSSAPSAQSSILGVPDVVVYNASIYQAEAALELSYDALRLALDIHVVGALNTAHCAIAAMQQTDHGARSASSASSRAPPFAWAS
jgi:NAD(P)-dependent dehydrogenase (short-subunit alcohol dehydrogenase family)